MWRVAGNVTHKPVHQEDERDDFMRQATESTDAAIWRALCCDDGSGGL